MKIMTCPLNGPRPITEFACGGPIKERPADDAGAPAWADYVFTEDNLAGIVLEWWYHVPTAFWFVAERDTRTDTIHRTMTVAAWKESRGRR